MPYRSNAELPDGVKNALPEHAQDIFRNAFNSVYAKNPDEQAAMQQAWGAVKNAGYEKDKQTEKWHKVKKADDPANDPVLQLLRSPNFDRLLAEIQGRDRAPNYRPCEDFQQCQNCAHAGQWNKCALYRFRFAPDWTCDTWQPGQMQAFKSGSETMANHVNVVKIDQEQQLVFGFFSINKVGADLVEDLQGDLIETNTLEKAAYDFVLNARVAGEQHVRENVGRLVESIMFTYEKQQAINKCLEAQGIQGQINLGCEGWFGGFKVDDEDVWKAVKAGDYPAFSIGGSGKRLPADD